MRRACTQIEAGGENLIGVGGHHVDTGKLLSSVDEDAQQHAAEGLCLSVLEELTVTERGFGLLCLMAGHDTSKLGDEVWMRFVQTAEFGEDFSALRESTMGDEPARTAES